MKKVKVNKDKTNKSLRFGTAHLTILADATNNYARCKSQTIHGNRCTDPTHPDYKKHCRLNSWIDNTPGDIKVFIAHILVMGLVKKADLEKYWKYEQ